MSENDNPKNKKVDLRKKPENLNTFDEILSKRITRREAISKGVAAGGAIVAVAAVGAAGYLALGKGGNSASSTTTTSAATSSASTSSAASSSALTSATSAATSGTNSTSTITTTQMSSDAANAAFLAEEQRLLAAIKANGETSITIYGSDFTTTTNGPPSLAAFQARYPGLSFQGVSLSLYELSPRITAEQAAGTDDFDILVAGGPGILPLNQWIMPYTSPLMYAADPAWQERIYKGLMYIMGPYVDVAFAWNTQMIKNSQINFNKNWFAPMDPQFSSQLGIDTPAAYGYNSAWFINMRVILDSYNAGTTPGTTWQGFAQTENGNWENYMIQAAKTATQFQTGVYNDIVSGSVGMGIAVGSVATILNLQTSGAPIDYFIAQNTYNSPIKIGVYYHSKSPNLAKLFLNWTLWRGGWQSMVGQPAWRQNSIYPDLNTPEYQAILSGKTITEDPSPDYPVGDPVYNSLYAIPIFNNKNYTATPPPYPNVPVGGYPSYTGPIYTSTATSATSA